MVKHRCTIDSSCLIALDHVDLLTKLSFVYRQVLVPKAVRIELSRRRTTKNRLRSLFKRYAFLQPCDRFDQTAVYIHLTERRPGDTRDRGEIEAVVQAVETDADVIVDDKWGRRLARRRGLAAHGTFWVLEQLYGLRIVSALELHQSFLVLKDLQIYLPWKRVNALLARIGEAPL